VLSRRKRICTGESGTYDEGGEEAGALIVVAKQELGELAPANTPVLPSDFTFEMLTFRLTTVDIRK
jgi:hypothetical protein